MDTTIFYKLIKRLGREPMPPRYPHTLDLDNTLVELVTKLVLEKEGQMPYNVDRGIVNNIIRLDRLWAKQQ